MLRRSAFFLIAVAGIGWGGDVLKDRQYVVAVVGPAALYSLPPHEYPEVNPLVATLPLGAALRVLRVRYGKDFEALKVETSSGVVGWVIGGEGVKVMSRG